MRCVETEPREAECQLGSSLPSQEKLVSILTRTGGANTLLAAQRPEERLFTWCTEIFFLNQTEINNVQIKKGIGMVAQHGQSSPKRDKMGCM